MNKVTLKERLQYWFDKQMAKGSMSLIKLLSVATIFVILLVTLLGTILGFNEDGFLSVFGIVSRLSSIPGFPILKMAKEVSAI